MGFLPGGTGTGIYKWGVRWLTFLFELCLWQKWCAVPVTVFSFASGIVIGNPHTAPESDTEGASQALPHTVMHVYYMLLTLFLLMFLIIIDDLLPPELSVLPSDIPSSLGMLGGDYRFPLRFAILSSFCSFCWEDGTLKYVNIFDKKCGSGVSTTTDAGHTGGKLHPQENYKTNTLAAVEWA